MNDDGRSTFVFRRPSSVIQKMLIDQSLQFITVLLWTVFLLFIAVYLLYNSRRRGFQNALRGVARWSVLFLLVIIMFVTYVNLGIVFIEPQDVGVVVSVTSPQGYQDRPLRSGLRWVLPFLENVYIYPIYFQTYTMSSSPLEGGQAGDDAIKARTSDGQEVSLDSSLIFQIDPAQAVRIHIDWQGRYIEDFVRPVTRGVVRTLVSQYEAQEVNSSKRLDLERDINDELARTFADKGFNLDRFILRNISFSPEYALAVEQKQVAEQGVIASEHQAEQTRQLARGEADAVLVKAQADAEAVRVKAQAEADALKLISGALAGDEKLLQYRYIEKLSPAIRVMLVPNNAPYLLPLPDLNATGVVTPTVSPTGTLTTETVPNANAPAATGSITDTNP
jgi:regulator of protease activity HflC (stomatin/prohibitin superfamily)